MQSARTGTAPLTSTAPRTATLSRTLTASVVAALRDVVRLVLPVECPGCGRWDETLCDACASVLVGPAVRCEEAAPRLDRLDGSPPLPVWCVTRYAGPARGVVLAWKDHGRADLTPVLVEAVRRVGVDLAPVLGRAASGRPLVVVPVPSSPGARRRRGADLVGLLAAGVAEGLATTGLQASSGALLSRRRRPDQVGLGARARRANTAGSVRLRRRRPGDPSALHVLVDDVLTTGSTLATCEDVLVTAGLPVLAGVVLAATPAPSGARRRLLLRAWED